MEFEIDHLPVFVLLILELIVKMNLKNGNHGQLVQVF